MRMIASQARDTPTGNRRMTTRAERPIRNIQSARKTRFVIPWKSCMVFAAPISEQVTVSALALAGSAELTGTTSHLCFGFSGGFGPVPFLLFERFGDVESNQAGDEDGEEELAGDGLQTCQRP